MLRARSAFGPLRSGGALPLGEESADYGIRGVALEATARPRLHEALRNEGRVPLLQERPIVEGHPRQGPVLPNPRQDLGCAAKLCNVGRAGDESETVLGQFLAQRASGLGVEAPGRGKDNRASRLRDDLLEQLEAFLPELLAREAHIRGVEDAVHIQEEHRR